MLLRYIVSNYKSIGHSVEFSMFPAENNEDDRFLKTITTRAGEWKVLRRGGFFGPNASGKSTFIDSIAFARNYIINGQKSGKSTGVDQYRGVIEDLNGVTTFQFVFYLEQEVYEYGFSLDRYQIHEEWLMQLTETDFAPMFTRVTDDNAKTKIDIDSKLASVGSKTREVAEILKNSIHENQKNQLFLYKLSENGIKKAEKVVGWFKDLQMIFPRTRVRALPIRMRTDEDLRSYISRMLNQMDTGVFEISVASEDIDFHEYAEKLNLSPKLIEEVEEVKNGMVTIGGRCFMFSEDNNNKRTTMIQIKFNHHLEGKDALFELEDESDGTKRLLDLLPMLFTLGKNTTLYFIDEIDRSLHTKLSQFLLDEFIRQVDDGENQIIFTAHDVNLINLRNFRQDEIWFIEKKTSGESTLRPLSDFQIDTGQDVLKGYLSGRFGAVPAIKGV